MEKFLKIGERYVQWIALGIGALYLVSMGWFYIIQAPVTVALDKTDCLPGELDAQIKKSMKPMIDDIHDTTISVKPKPVPAVEELKVAFVDHAPQGPPTALAPRDILTTQPGPVIVANPSIMTPPAPEASHDPPSGGLSVLNVPQPVPLATTKPAGVTPAAVAAAPVEPVLAPEDHDWNTFAWTISAKALDDAFQAAHIPDLPNIYQTAFLRVEVVREEILPNGQTGTPKVLPDIPTVMLAPMPTEKAANEDKTAYRDSAAANAGNILTPPFFAVSYGTPWYAPGSPKPPDVFPPLGAPLPAAQPLLPPQPLVPRGPGLVPAPGVLMPHHRGPSLPPPPPQTPHGVYGRPYQPAAAPTMPPSGYNQAQLPAAGAAGFIDPRQAPDITIYTHDWTAEAGHIYRYKMHYAISNPLFSVEQENVTQAERNQLAIWSPYSGWTAAVEIPSHYKFWVQKFQRNSNEVTFDLFTRKPSAPGGLERSTIRANPGDSIGPSPWLLVDVRQDANRRIPFFLVAGPAGNIERHEIEKDKNDPDHLEMLDKSGASAIGAGG